MIAVEIAVQDAAGARTAFEHGADRVELCQALAETGGLTPSAGTIDAVCEAAGGGRVAVLVRPRPGGFVYDAEEIALVAADLRDCVRRGAGGVVVGALRPDGGIDRDAMRRWKEAAGDAEFVFHRAIDALADPASVIDELAELGTDRVLTSGGAARSIDGIEVLAALARQAAGRLQIMSGGGVRVEDIPDLVSAGIDAVHLSARVRSADEAPSGPGGGVMGFDVTEPAIVAAAVRAVRGV
ncbi:copper homeostasis protein CutC [Microbacterium murale]|uniref:PF03932 family protein CutC n=1 Tax=Microbacterium murale TaxID=1081040 RepID=A0ABU0PDA1_9MICO|nr:copper homeostasis protein CutC [Microbacterium murale]MDQ0645298.1 copper homeostasis protein [Microbacterium murale]